MGGPLKKRAKFFLSVIFLLIPIHILIPQNSTTRVLVDITLNQKTPNESGTILTGFVIRELRKLNDIIIVDDNEDFKINILMFENRTKTGDSLGYVISTIFLAPDTCEGYKSYSYLTSSLSTAKKSEFEVTAKNIAVYFDQDILKVYRK